MHFLAKYDHCFGCRQFENRHILNRPIWLCWVSADE